MMPWYRYEVWGYGVWGMGVGGMGYGGMGYGVEDHLMWLGSDSGSSCLDDDDEE